MITKQAMPIVDKEIRSLILNTNVELLVSANAISSQFIASYLKWINSGDNFKVFGLDKLYAYITDGITDAFNNFHLTYPTRETVVLPGEYPQHKRMGATVMESSTRSGYMPIYSGSKFIVSYPFSATGTVPKEFEDLMGTCSRRDIPVFLDCAFHGISNVEPIDISAYDCIKFVGFSLSKTFATGWSGRVGLCFTKEEQVYAPMHINTEWQYYNHASITLHNILMETFSSDYIYNKYRNKQVKVCDELGVVPSDTIVFGTTKDNKYLKFTRDDVINRLCISYLLQEDQID